MYKYASTERALESDGAPNDQIGTGPPNIPANRATHSAISAPTNAYHVRRSQRGNGGGRSCLMIPRSTMNAVGAINTAAGIASGCMCIAPCRSPCSAMKIARVAPQPGQGTCSHVRVGQIGTGANTTSANDTTNKTARPHRAEGATGAFGVDCSLNNGTYESEGSQILFASVWMTHGIASIVGTPRSTFTAKRIQIRLVLSSAFGRPARC